MTLFVDTSAWYAAADRDDASNDRAKAILSAGEDLVATDHVLVETWLLVRRRLGWQAAESFWGGLRGPLVTLERITPADMATAWAVGRVFGDQDFSIVDRTSFAVMERLRLGRVASFDNDFSIYRFGLDRDRAFTVVR